MKNPPVQSMQCYLLPRVCDTIRLRLCRQCATVLTPCCAPHCIQFDSGCLCGMPSLESPCTETLKNGCSCLRAMLCLPVSLRLCRECEFFTVSGIIRVPIEAALRTSFSPQMQYIPKAELCISDVQLQDGGLCAVFDLTVTIYAAELQPVTLPILCAKDCSADCSPFFNLPLYPELPARR